MTIFGPDVSSYQTGRDLSQVPDTSFIIAKTSEGTYYTDTAYPGFRSQAAHLGKPFIWYHLVTPEPAADQVRHTLACVGDPTLPGMIDCEPSGDKPGPTWPQILEYVAAALDAGLNLRLYYLPHWYWEQIGSPGLAPLAKLGLVASDYTPTPGIYPGDGVAGWLPYGGVTPEILQDTDNQGGLDFNAYRGPIEDLTAFLHPSQGADMAVTFASGQINSGAGARTLICPPPANTGANWGNVWVSFGADFGTAVLRVAAYIHGSGWQVLPAVSVPAGGDRVNPFGGPAPTGIQKISVVRDPGSEDVPVGWLVEAQSK